MTLQTERPKRVLKFDAFYNYQIIKILTVICILLLRFFKVKNDISKLSGDIIII